MKKKSGSNFDILATIAVISGIAALVLYIAYADVALPVMSSFFIKTPAGELGVEEISSEAAVNLAMMGMACFTIISVASSIVAVKARRK